MKLIRRIGPLRMEAIKVTAFGGLFWFAWSFACYQSVYLQEIGFSASDVGLLNSICALVAIVAVAFWGMVSDRIGSHKKVLIFILFMGSLCYMLIPKIPYQYNHSILIFILIPVFNFFRSSMASMTENLQVRSCNVMRINYGFSRSFGSLLFTIGSLIAAALLRHIELKQTFTLSFIIMLPVVLITCFIRNPNSSSKRKKSSEKATDLFKNKLYITFLIFALLFYIGYTCAGGFIPYYMSSIGINANRYGIILAYRAVLEMPFLLLINRLRKRFSLPQLLIAGVAMMMAESLFLSIFAHSLPTMLIAETFYGLGNGLFIGSSMNYLYQMAPNNLKASAQAFYTSVASFAGIIGNLFGGILFDAIGAKPFYLVIFFIYLISIAVFSLSLMNGRQQSKVKAA